MSAEISHDVANGMSAAAAEACQRIDAILEVLLPTPEYMSALKVELQAAAEDPTSVPSPDLIDAARFWDIAVRPQLRTIHDQVTTVLSWLEAQVVSVMAIAEREMRVTVEEAIGRRSADAAADRADLERRLQEYCGEVAAQIDGFSSILQLNPLFTRAQQAFNESLVAASSHDVDGLHEAYMRDAGGDDAHQTVAQQEWEATYNDRVEFRKALSEAEAPWRHQSLSIAGYERACNGTRAMLEHLCSNLKAPLSGIPRFLVEDFDRSVSSSR